MQTNVPCTHTHKHTHTPAPPPLAAAAPPAAVAALAPAAAAAAAAARSAVAAAPSVASAAQAWPRAQPAVKQSGSKTDAGWHKHVDHKTVIALEKLHPDPLQNVHNKH